MAEIEWTNSLAIRLIEAYKEKPELWDNTHYMYRVATAKYEAWSELATEFECDIIDLRRKLNSLFASHRREKAKIRNGGRSTWYLYPHMDFLPKHLPDESKVEVDVPMKQTIKTQSEPEETEESSEEEDTYDNVIQEEIIIKQEPVVETTVRSRKYRQTSPRASTHKPRLTRPIRKRLVKDSIPNKFDSKLIEMLRLLRRSELSKKKDECDSFGEYIADSLRKHDDKTQCMIKQAINNILFEQEMKKYNSSSTLTLVLNGLDENPLKLMDDSDHK